MTDAKPDPHKSAAWVKSRYNDQGVGCPICTPGKENKFCKVMLPTEEKESSCSQDCTALGASHYVWDAKTKQCWCENTKPSCDYLKDANLETCGPDSIPGESCENKNPVIFSSTSREKRKEQCSAQCKIQFRSKGAYCENKDGKGKCVCISPHPKSQKCATKLSGKATYQANSCETGSGNKCPGDFCYATESDHNAATPAHWFQNKPTLNNTEAKEAKCVCDSEVAKEFVELWTNYGRRSSDRLSLSQLWEEAIKQKSDPSVLDSAGNHPSELKWYFDRVLREHFANMNPDGQYQYRVPKAEILRILGEYEACRMYNTTKSRDLPATNLMTHPGQWLREHVGSSRKPSYNTASSKALNVGFKIAVYLILAHLLLRQLFPLGGFQNSLVSAMWMPKNFKLFQFPKNAVLLFLILLCFIILASILLASGRESEDKKSTFDKFLSWYLGSGFTLSIVLVLASALVVRSGSSFVYILFIVGLLIFRSIWAGIFHQNAGEVMKRDIWFYVLVSIAFVSSLIGGYTGKPFLTQLPTWSLATLPTILLYSTLLLLNFAITYYSPSAEFLILILYRFFPKLLWSRYPSKDWAKIPMKIFGTKKTDNWVMPFVPIVSWLVSLFYKVSKQAPPNYLTVAPGRVGVTNSDIWLS